MQKRASIVSVSDLKMLVLMFNHNFISGVESTADFLVISDADVVGQTLKTVTAKSSSLCLCYNVQT